MARIDVAFIHEDTLHHLRVASMVSVPRKGDEVRMIHVDGHEINGIVSHVQWIIYYDKFGNPNAQDVDVHLSITEEIASDLG